MTTTRGPGLVDLEKELVCSICTELLYQPLTVLDCLHTFCGSCLKEWFSAQGSRPRSSRSSPRFTCPSCRAVVRETRPNATVTTLLDMVLTANPDQVKSDAEKEEISQRYKPGDSVFPTTTHADSSAESDEDDRRLLEEVRELSLRDSSSRTGDSNHRTRHSSRSRHTDRTDADGRSRRRREERRLAPPRAERGAETSSERTRRIEHQSSLRSLLSLSDAETMEEEILRQIIEEGLLDDIDMDNLGPRQEEELSERIADAYRRRHRLRSRSQQRQETQDSPSTPSSHSRTRSQSVQRPPTVSTPREASRNPPVSRPYLLEPLVQRPGHPGHQRRLSEQGSSRRRTSPVPAHPASSSEVVLRPAARSSSDMTSERTRSSQTGRVRTTESVPLRARRATESEQNLPNIWTGGRERANRPFLNSPTVNSPTLRSVNASIPPRLGQGASASTASLVSPALTPGLPGQNGRSRPSSSRSNAPPASYIEPSISCDRCGKPNIQYELHKKCAECNDGKYHLCLRCYRSGSGCLQWAGFGPSAEANFEKILASSNGQPAPVREIPHVLISFKYRRPPGATHRIVNEDRQTTTSDDPARRLRTGLFCDICHSTTNDCFWKCNQCNEGDWGFCNRCVNRGRCCTHPLLPICRITPEERSNPPSSTDTPGDTSSPVSNDGESFKILSFSTQCDICTYPIPASTTRFHCLECNHGDYDICANCYLKLGATGKISKENGHNGWRRCLKGHRMIIIGFEDHEEGQRRVIVRDLVGGRALKDEHVQPSPTAHASPTTATPSPEVGTGDWSWREGAERRKKASRLRTPWTNGDHETPEPSPTTPIQSAFRRFPPDGGVGLTAHALWAWYPEAGVEDELMFPRGAEITEAENINDDWYWGCYAGSTGLFPGAHVTIVGEVA